MSDSPRADQAMQEAEPRLARIVKLGETLFAEIRTWINSHPLECNFVIDDDGHGWSFEVIGFRNNPDLEEWGVQFGELAHHFRSLLNNMLTRIARAEGLPRTTILQFPVAQTVKAWKKNELRRLEGLPDRVVRAIYANQPFIMARGGRGDPAMDVLSVLAWSDNEDKHEVELATTLRPQDFTVDRPPELDLGGPKLGDPEGEVEYDFSLTPGSRLVHVRYEQATVIAPGEVDFTLQMGIGVPDQHGNVTDIHVALDEFMDKVKHIMLTVLAAWDVPDVDIHSFAGSTDFKRGAAFGKAAVDGMNGDGTWGKDFLHTARYGEVRAEQRIESAVRYDGLGDLLGQVNEDVTTKRPPRP